MDFEPTDEQRAIGEALDALLARHAGPARAIELAAKGEPDAALAEALAEAGFDGLATGDDTGPLEAALATERIAAAAGVVPWAASAWVAPCVAGRPLAGPVALAAAGEEGPVRFAAHARTLLVADGDVARAVAIAPGDVVPVRSGFGYPMGHVPQALRTRGDALGAGSGPRLRAWWRVALAAEALGTMDAALRFTAAYLSERRQFGRPIGAFQAVQHRLAECALRVEGSRWLVYEAAARGAPDAAAATAAGHAAAAAGTVHRETHQLSGAIGYTTVHDLHVWSMRLQPLRLELGGAGAHFRALARARWSAAP